MSGFLDRSMMMARRLNGPLVPDTMPVPETSPDYGAPVPDSNAGWQQIGTNLTSGWGDFLGRIDPKDALGFVGGVRAYHGSPHSFEQFDLGKIGTGEGAQAFGHGLYFAENEGTAAGYRDRLSRGQLPVEVNGQPFNMTSLPQRQKEALLTLIDHGGDYTKAEAEIRSMYYPEQVPEMVKALDAVKQMNPTVKAQPGSMYEVNINADPEHFLHWDKPLSEQSPQVQKAVMQVASAHRSGDPADMDAIRLSKIGQPGERVQDWYDLNDPKFVQALRDAGIPGIRYLDQGSRATGEGTHNIVVFSPENIEILRKYGMAGLMGGGAAAAASQDAGQ